MLITGVSGFVGALTCRRALATGWSVRGTVRALRSPAAVPELELVATGDVGEGVDWTGALAGVQAVIHLAGVTAGGDVAAAEACERVNHLATLRLAEAAAGAGVRRFVYASSIKVNGEESGRSPFSEATRPAPRGAYARSKWRAEEGLHEIARRSPLEVTVVRPPLVHGAAAPGRFAQLLEAIDRGIPLPLGLACNRRSLVGVHNLGDFLVRCAECPAAGNEVFLVSDGEDFALCDVVRILAEGMGRRPRLLPLPPALARAGARLLGRRDAAGRLFGSLRIDDRKARALLGWAPPEPAREALLRTGAGFAAQRAPAGFEHEGRA
jgi:nucleoside-diphosphate-sugar epimerase